MSEASLAVGEGAVSSQMQAHLSTDTGWSEALPAHLGLCPGLYTDDLRDYRGTSSPLIRVSHAFIHIFNNRVLNSQRSRARCRPVNIRSPTHSLVRGVLRAGKDPSRVNTGGCCFRSGGQRRPLRRGHSGRDVKQVKERVRRPDGVGMFQKEGTHVLGMQKQLESCVAGVDGRREMGVEGEEGVRGMLKDFGFLS